MSQLLGPYRQVAPLTALPGAVPSKMTVVLKVPPVPRDIAPCPSNARWTKIVFIKSLLADVSLQR